MTSVGNQNRNPFESYILTVDQNMISHIGMIKDELSSEYRKKSVQEVGIRPS